MDKNLQELHNFTMEDNSSIKTFQEKVSGEKCNLFEKDKLLDSNSQDKAKRRTLCTSYISLFLSFTSSSATLSSIWPYMKSMDGNIKEAYLGWVNFTFCFCQFCACIVFGYWQDIRGAMEPMYLSSSLLFIGNIFYMFANSFQTNGIYVALLARAILGISAGNVAVVRAIGAELSTNEERAKVMAIVSFCQALGVIFGPVLQAIVKPMEDNNIVVGGINLHLNIYTIPCLFMLVFSIVIFLLQYFYLKEGLQYAVKSVDDKVDETCRIDFIGVVVSIFTWFSTVTMFTVSEIIVSPTTLNDFAWTKEKSVFYTSIILGANGAIAIGCFLFIIPLSRRLEERLVILIGFVIMIIGLILMLPWGPNDHKLTSKGGNATEVVGCPYEYSWCHTTPAIPLSQFLVGVFIGMIGFSFCMVTAKILLSKIVGPYPQGKFMGWFSAAGSISRSIAALYVSYIYQYYGLRWASVGLQCLLLLTVFVIGVNWKRLIPFGTFKIDKKIYENM